MNRHSLAKLFQRDTILGISNGYLAVGGNFLLQILLVRLLGQSSFGLFALLRNNSQMIGGFAAFGLDSVVINRIKGERDQAMIRESGRRLFWSCLLIVAMLALLFWLPITFLADYDILSSQALWLTLFAGWCLGSTIILTSQVRAYGNSIAALFIQRSVAPIALIASIMGLLWADLLDLFSSALAFAGTSLIVFLLAVALLVKTWAALPSKAVDGDRIEPVVPLMREALPYFFVALSGIAGSRIPIYVGGLILSFAQLGSLVLMTSVAGLVMIGLFSINLLYGPKVAECFARGMTRESHDGLMGEIRFFALLSTIIGIAGAAIALPAIRFLTQEENLIPLLPFSLIVLAAIIGSLANIPSTVLKFAGKQVMLARITNVSILVKIALAVILGIQFGLIGFAIAEFVQAISIGTLVRHQHAKLVRDLPN
ncbi:hypothetical protein [Qipengyuania sp. JC766]|uniref:lipopolysaccharide biosynthesis protein n=1 Tax=Qipengyuania sp. JC766 TaxID=3232139 RepID=UPI00345B3880